MSGEHADSSSHAWTQAAPSLRAGYGLAVRDCSLRTAFGLLTRTLPCAFARFGILALWSVGCILWILAAFGGARLLSAEYTPALGSAWLMACLVAGVWISATALRRALNFMACGHVAVLTALITRGQAGNDRRSMPGYGEALLARRFGEPAVLFGMTRLLRCNLRAFHASLVWTSQVTSARWPKSRSIVRSVVSYGTTRSLEKIILSYNLARGEGDAWAVMREGFVYYAQNAGPLLAASVRAELLERACTVVLAVLLLAPAAAVTFVLPDAVRPPGGAIAVAIAILLAAALRSAFIKPMFLTTMIVQFHVLIENQAIDPDWQQRLVSIPGTFGTLAPGFVMPRGMRGFWPGSGR